MTVADAPACLPTPDRERGDTVGTDDQAQAVSAALSAAVDAALRGPLTGGNPQVGCVLWDAHGTQVAIGYHAGRGSAHAEAAALAALPDPACVAGGTAIVTLEPCAHTGLTPPCALTLADAGLARVIYAVPDPNPLAGGGAALLRNRGVAVHQAADLGVDEDVLTRARALTAIWRATITRARPWVIAKTAMSADGYVAAADGTSQWITGEEARSHAHRVRAGVDAIMIGTGTALADDPQLTQRAGGTWQPLRVVLGHRPLPHDSRLARSGYLALTTHDVAAALETLAERGLARVLIEGGPTLVSAALRADLVDEWHCYRAPLLLGEGRAAIGPLGIATLGQARRFARVDHEVLGEDVWERYAVSEEARDVYGTC